jgi:uncharacterized BrkB/YihY/UPF0761 family membrane protein
VTKPDATGNEDHRSLVTKARTTAQTATKQLQDARRRSPVVDAAFEVYERDREVNGNIFAGAVAFRLFLWFLPLSLVVVAGLSFALASGTDPHEAMENFGVSGTTAATIAENLSTSKSSRWWLITLGVIALYGASITLAKAIYRVHAIAWRSPESRLRSHPKVAGLVIFVAGGVLAVTGLAARVRALSGPGWFLRLGMLALYAAVALGVSWLLPHRDAPVRWLMPGAVTTAVGVVVLHLVTVVYFSRKLNSASELYGNLGTATVVLLWLYLIARLLVASAVLNATLWDRHLAQGSRAAD